ncbi:MAG: hypothetical protein ACJ8BW_39405 [Ktedonobacteraceae bacterium]
METVASVLVVVILLLSLMWLIIGCSSMPSSAKRRADELLRVVLTCEQYRQWILQGCVDIPSPSDPQRTYRVQKYPHPTQVRERGRVQMWLCLLPLERVPDADLVVIHKLLIESDEQDYLQKANRMVPLHASRTIP